MTILSELQIVSTTTKAAMTSVGLLQLRALPRRQRCATKWAGENPAPALAPHPPHLISNSTVRGASLMPIAWR